MRIWRNPCGGACSWPRCGNSSAERSEEIMQSNHPHPSTGRVTVHPRGFGFINIDGPEGETSAFVAPPDLNEYLDGDLVTALVTLDAAGRASASSLALVERSRSELFGTVTLHGRRRFLHVDRLVSNTDWPFE